MTVVDRFVQAVSHGGAMRKPTLIVVHSAETPLKAGYAKSIAENWFGRSASTSAHFMVDPVEVIRLLSDNVVAYHVGPKANGFTLGIEQAGYARFSRAEWTTPAGLAQLGSVGALVRELGQAHGIPLRWATDDQIRAAAHGTPGGVCFHDDIARVLGGTTHTDPMPNYPRDLLQQAWNGAIQEDDMTPDQAAALNEIRGFMQNVAPAVGQIAGRVADVHWKIVGAQYDLADRPRPGVDDLLGHVLSTRAAVEQGTSAGRVAVDAAAVGAALAADDEFMGALSARIADDIAARLQS